MISERRRKPKRWFIYALGGGMGHLHRSIALARAAVRKSPPTEVVVLTNSPFANCLPLSKETGPDVQVIAVNPNLDREATIEGVKNAFRGTQFDLLIVDTFPRGLGGELPEITADLHCPKTLVHRHLNPQYIEQANLSEVCQQFDQLIVPGEAAPFETFSNAVKTAPWLIRDAVELLSPAEARDRLKVASDSFPVVAVIGCGNDEEVEQMRQLAIQLEVDIKPPVAIRFITPRPSSSVEVVTINLWPLMDVMRGISVVVGSGGYNTVQETRAVGTPLIGLPRKRLYDSQVRRLKGGMIAQDYRDVRSLVEESIKTPLRIESESLPNYQNGVHAAVEMIKSLSNSKE